jgi:RimJ/RimL family protein N-acetyltransferase
MKREYDMKSVTESSKGEYQICYDVDGRIAEWVCRGLNFDFRQLQTNITFGFAVDGQTVGGLIFHDLRYGQDVWWTVFSTDKRWCNRRMLKQMFGLAFSGMQCRRINILVSKDNEKSLNFVQKLGFVKEGLLRSFRENGEDCFLLGMLKSECKWI